MKFDIFKRMKKSVIEEDDEDKESDGDDESRIGGALNYLDPNYDKKYDRTASVRNLD